MSNKQLITHPPKQEIPYGFCHCGCGQKTNLAERTKPLRGYIKGQPMKFLLGHARAGGCVPIPVRKRFERHISMEPMTGCWLWTAHTIMGYGRFVGCGASTMAHRAAWIIYVGPIPDGISVLHRCDTPECVNPLHLFLGTYTDNVRDAIKKGRFKFPPFGEAHHSSKVTIQDVITIRNDPRSIPEIAREYGLTYWATQKIKERLSWKHVT